MQPEDVVVMSAYGAVLEAFAEGDRERTAGMTEKFNAASTETLNLVVPADVKPLGPEFARLAADVSQAIGSTTGAGPDISKLAQAQEDDDHHDLSLLSQSTSWDARLVGMVAIIGPDAFRHDLLDRRLSGFRRVFQFARRRPVDAAADHANERAHRLRMVAA